MHTRMNTGLLRPQDLSLLAGHSCTPAPEIVSDTAAHRSHSSRDSEPSSPQKTCQPHECRTREQYVLTLNECRKLCSRAMPEDGTAVRDAHSFAVGAVGPTKADFNGNSSTEKRVVVRIRGMSLNSGKKLALCVHPNDHAKILCNRGTCLQEFQFSRVFADPDTNEDVYRDIGGDRIVVAVGNGIKETILAYGQTGSGKTHSAAGLEQTISLCAIEVLGDVLYDLLPDSDSASEDESPPKIRWEECFIKTGKYKYKVITVDDEEAALRVLEEARQQRKVGGSYLNARSSRSHAIVQFFVHTRFSANQASEAVQAPARSEIATEDCAFYGVLTLADLAGCERELPSYLPRSLTSLAGALSKDEGKWGCCSRALNTSISALNRLIRKMQTGALDESDRRQSALNRVLFDYLQPECGVCMLFCLNPEASELQVSLSTLTIATHCRLIPCSRRQYLLPLGPLRKFYAYNILSQSANRIKGLLQARSSADAPTCINQGRPPVTGGETGGSLGTIGLRPSSESELEAAKPVHTSTKEPVGSHSQISLHCGPSDKMASCGVGPSDNGTLMFRKISERPPSFLAQTRETQTDESCLCPQGFSALQREKVICSCCPAETEIPPCCQRCSIKMIPHIRSSEAQKDAEMATPDAGDTDVALSSSSDSEAGSQNGVACLDACSSKGCAFIQCDKKRVHQVKRESRQRRTACCSVAVRDHTSTKRAEQGENSPTPIAHQGGSSSSGYQTKAGATRSSYFRKTKERRGNISRLPRVTKGARISGESPSTRLSSAASARVDNTRSSSPDKKSVHYEHLRQLSQCARCSTTTNKDTTIRRRHRRRCRHLTSEQLHIVALNRLRQQQEEEIQAEIEHLEKKLTSLVHLCASEGSSSRTGHRAQINVFDSSSRACYETPLSYLLSERRRVAPCKSGGFPTGASESDRKEDDQDAHSDEYTCQQRAGECDHGIRTDLHKSTREDKGVTALGVRRSIEPTLQITASRDLLEKENRQNSTSVLDKLATVCGQNSRTSLCQDVKMLDEPLVEIRTSSVHSNLCSAKSMEEFYAASPGPAVLTETSEQRTSSTGIKEALSLQGCMLHELEKQHVSGKAPLRTGIRQSKQPPARAVKASSMRLSDIGGKGKLLGDASEEQQAHSVTAMAAPHIASYASEMLPSQVAVPCVSSSTTVKSFSCKNTSVPSRGSKILLEGISSHSCLHRLQHINSRELKPKLPNQKALRQPGTQKTRTVTAGTINYCGSNGADAGFSKQEQGTPLEIEDQTELSGVRKRQNQSKDFLDDSDGSYRVLSADPELVATPGRPLHRQLEDTCEDMRRAPVPQPYSKTEELLTPQVPLMIHREQPGQIKDCSWADECGEGWQLQRRLRELLHLRQQRNWPQSDETQKENADIAKKHRPEIGKYIRKHTETNLQREMEQIIQRLNGMRVH